MDSSENVDRKTRDSSSSSELQRLTVMGSDEVMSITVTVESSE